MNIAGVFGLWVLFMNYHSNLIHRFLNWILVYISVVQVFHLYEAYIQPYHFEFPHDSIVHMAV